MGELDLSRSDYTAARARGKYDEDRGYASRSSSYGYENAKAREYGDMEWRKGVSYAFQISASATSIPARKSEFCCDKLEGDMDPCHGLTLTSLCDQHLGSCGKAPE